MLPEAFTDTYEQVLGQYLTAHSEEALYQASLLSQTFVEQGLGPEEIIALHFEALDGILKQFSYRQQARAVGDAHQFLLEVMINYGVRYKEFLELRMRESLREAEARVALERSRAVDAERAEQEKIELLAMIAHELRTPITAAMGSLDMATRTLTRGDVARLPSLIGSAREALSRLSRLSASLFQASKGDLPHLDLQPLSITRVLDQACAWANAAAHEKGVRFERHDRSDDLNVLGDEDALLSIFGNLLSNAVQYTQEYGTVTVDVGDDGGHVWISVRDTGIGMSPEVQAHIFERFYRAPEARGVDAHGLGLGLALVHGLVTAHDGSIEVSSTAGDGSEFRVTLPRWQGDDDTTGAGGEEVGRNNRKPRSAA